MCAKHGSFVAILSFLLLIVLTGGCAEEAAPVATETSPISQGIATATTVPLNPQRIWQNGRGQARRVMLDRSGQFAAAATSQGLYLYETSAWSLQQTFSPDQPVYTAVFSPDSRFLAYVPLNSNQVEIWDLARQQPLRTLPHAEAPQRHLAFAPDGETLASASFDTLHLWRTEDGGDIAHIKPESGGRIRDLAFAADGSLVAASLIQEGADELAFWLAADGRPSGTISPGDDLWLANVQFSPNATLLAAEYGAGETYSSSADGLFLHYLGPPTPTRRLQIESRLITSAWAFSAAGQWLAAGYQDSQIAIWPLDSAQPPTMLPGPPAGELLTLAASGTGESITAFYDDGLVRRFSLPDGSLIAEQEIAYSQQEWQIEDTGEERLLLRQDNGRFQAWDTQSGTLLTSNDDHSAGPISSLAFSPDGQTLAVGMGTGLVHFLDVTDGETVGQLPDHAGGVDALAFAPDGRSLASGVGERISALAFDDTVRIWSWPDQELQREMSGDKDEVAGCSAFQNQIAFSPDGRLLAAASHDFTVQLWQADGSQLLHTLAGHEAPILDLAMAPDGSVLASAAEDGTVRVWSADDGQPLGVLQSPAFGWQSVSFAPDGSTLAAATAAGEIMLWDMPGADLVAQFSAALNPRSDLVFSADGSLLAGAVGSEVYLWQAAAGDLAYRLAGPGGQVTSLAFSKDGRSLAAGTQQGSTALWRLQTTD